MCGIYLTNIKYKDKEISKKLDFMQFRGPDNKSIYKSDGLIFGHLRLKILDLDKRSNQPCILIILLSYSMVKFIIIKI